MFARRTLGPLLIHTETFNRTVLRLSYDLVVGRIGSLDSTLLALLKQLKRTVMTNINTLSFKSNIRGK